MKDAYLYKDVFCNPLSLPDYPAGICAPSRIGHSDPGGFMGPVADYRELADPELLYDEGTWYMFPSSRQAYVSTDLAHWTYKKVAIENDLGYAPSIAKVNGKYVLTSSVLFRGTPHIYVAEAPLGPYKDLGPVLDVDGTQITPEYLDPSLFSDEGHLYLYWGCSPAGGGIFGLELDTSSPNKAICPKKKLIEFDPCNEFERFGDHNEQGNMSWVEGVAMFRHNGEYYLQYACNGTVFRRYAIGVYRGKTPLGPFICQRTPVCLSPYGMVCGSGHGGWVQGKDGDVWQFYTCVCRRTHQFERRIGMDKVRFDDNGDAHVQITSTPQSVSQGDLGLVPVSVNKRVAASSFEYANYPAFACDECTHTWWAPAKDDALPWIEVNCRAEYDFQAIQICWAELNLDFKSGICPEPVRFLVSFFDVDGRQLEETLSFEYNKVDNLIEYFTFKPVYAQTVRITILPSNNGIRHGVTELTVFARPISPNVARNFEL
ncbi:MAG: family 43 glycosylhydrolase [Victivallales bacterium]|nr:family 43 glycosylhydrolase [Victivallales bacterium]